MARDEIGYGVVATCAYGQQRLSMDERRELTSSLSANLGRGIGQAGDDTVLLGSLSALDLTVLAALALQPPALKRECDAIASMPPPI